MLGKGKRSGQRAEVLKGLTEKIGICSMYVVLYREQRLWDVLLTNPVKNWASEHRTCGVGKRLWSIYFTMSVKKKYEKKRREDGFEQYMSHESTRTASQLHSTVQRTTVKQYKLKATIKMGSANEEQTEGRYKRAEHGAHTASNVCTEGH